MHVCVYAFVKPCTELTCTFIAVLVQLDTMLSHCNHSFLYTLQFSQSCPTLCNPIDCSMTVFPVHYQFLEPTQVSIMLMYIFNSIFLWKWSESEIHSVVSNSLQPHGLCSPWNFPGQNTGEGSLLQEIFPTQGSNPGLPHCGHVLYQLSHKGSPNFSFAFIQFIVITSFVSQHSPAIREFSFYKGGERQ